MIEIRISKKDFQQRNEILCSLHVMSTLRDAGVPVIGRTTLVGVTTGVLTIWNDAARDEYVYQWDKSARGDQLGGTWSGRFHEDAYNDMGNPFGHQAHVARARSFVPMNSTLSPYAPTFGHLHFYTDETLDGDEYVMQWEGDDEL